MHWFFGISGDRKDDSPLWYGPHKSELAAKIRATKKLTERGYQDKIACICFVDEELNRIRTSYKGGIWSQTGSQEWMKM